MVKSCSLNIQSDLTNNLSHWTPSECEHCWQDVNKVLIAGEQLVYVWCGSIISFAESEREKRFDRQSAGYESCWHLKSQVGLTKVLLVHLLPGGDFLMQKRIKQFYPRVSVYTVWLYREFHLGRNTRKQPLKGLYWSCKRIKSLGAASDEKVSSDSNRGVIYRKATQHVYLL